MTARWAVVDMDDGIVRWERTKKACLEWAKDWKCANDILSGQRRLGVGFYEYFLGEDRENAGQVWICRGDLLARMGFDPEQAPVYSDPDDPFRSVPRDDEREREAGEDISSEIFEIDTRRPITPERAAAKARARRLTRQGAKLSPDQIERLRMIFSNPGGTSGASEGR